MGNLLKTTILLIACFCLAMSLCQTASAATTELRVIKYAPDAKTVLGERTINYQWMEANLPVRGDGITRYYHQGPVFIDDPDTAMEAELRWNAAEDRNVKEKDMGAVKGTSVRDLCDLVGGMASGDTVTITAEDGFSCSFANENVYTPSARQGEMVVTWYYSDEGYVPEYRQGMRLIFLADNSTNPYGLHIFGNADWKSSASPQYWYYYQQGQPPERYPTTTGLSVQYIDEIRIQSAGTVPIGTTTGTEMGQPASPEPTRSSASLLPALSAAGLVLVQLARARRNP